MRSLGDQDIDLCWIQECTRGGGGQWKAMRKRVACSKLQER